MPEPHPFSHLSPNSTVAKPSAEQCVTLSITLPHSYHTLYADLGDRMRLTLSAMALPPPLLRSGLPAGCLPTRDLRIRSLRDCAPGPVVALMRAHPPRALVIPGVPTRSSTPYLLPILLLPSDPITSPGIHRQWEGIIPPTVLNPLEAPSKRGRHTDPLALLRPEFLVTPMITLAFRHPQRLTLP
jgi:hypothetical protein